MKKLLIMTVAAMATAFSVVASSAATFAYQGVLRNEDGKVPASPATIDFKLYEAAEGGNAVWGRRMSVAIGANGLFKAELADANGTKTVASEVALADVIVNAETNQNVSLYIGVTVSGAASEIRPRQKLLSPPMAAYAQNLTEAKGDFKVGGELEVTGNINSTNGFVTAKGITVSGSSASSFAAPVDFASGVTIGGADSAATNLTVNGPIAMKGNINLSRDSKILLNGGFEGTLAIGTITLWSGSPSALPPGWILCAPRNGKTIYYKLPLDGSVWQVPDLRGRFVVGINYKDDDEGVHYQKNDDFSEYMRDAKGGEETHTLTTAEMPAHRHEYLGDDVLGQMKNDAAVALTERDYKFDLSSQEDSYNGVKYNTSPIGGGEAHENRPPFFALCYIMFIGDCEVE